MIGHTICQFIDKVSEEANEPINMVMMSPVHLQGNTHIFGLWRRFKTSQPMILVKNIVSLADGTTASEGMWLPWQIFADNLESQVKYFIRQYDNDGVSFCKLNLDYRSASNYATNTMIGIFSRREDAEKMVDAYRDDGYTVKATIEDYSKFETADVVDIIREFSNGDDN